MSSPRSMWSGTLRLGLLTVPITLAKATSEQREKALVTVCEHGVPINRSERCGAGEETCTLSKSKAVQVGEDEYRTLEPNEYLAIEDSTKSDTLDVLDVQPLRELPLIFGMGTYYVRADAKVRGSEQGFAILHAALAKTKQGLVVKLCRSASQKLCVIHASEGLLLLTQIPFMAELRKPGEQERSHWETEAPEAQVALATELLSQQRNPDGFAWPDYIDNGYKMRTAVVDRILADELPLDDEGEQQEREIPEQAPDIMAKLMAAVEAGKS